MCYKAWIHSCKYQNYDFCILQECSEGINVKWAELQPSSSSFFVILHTKKCENWPIFHEVIQKKVAQIF